MKDMDTGDDKIRKICDAIKSQTIEPAKQQADEIIENAKMEAKAIRDQAESERKKIIQAAEKEILQKQKLCHSSIKSASKQVIDRLKQEIENEFFTCNLHDIITKATSSPEVVADLVEAVVQGIEKEGVDVDLSAVIPKKVKLDKVNKLLAKDVLDKLREKKVIEAEFSGGAKIKLHEKQMTIDISDLALTNLVASLIREDFRNMIFNV